MNAAGSKVEILLVAFQSALYNVRSCSYARGYIHVAHSLPYARNVVKGFGIR